MAKKPEKVGKYKILDQIGKGGMGIVYTAQHPTLKRKVILKKLTIRDKEFRERFRLEADVMMDLRSDYIVDLYDHFKEGSSWYIAMEYIEGITLEELIQQEGALDFRLVSYIMYCTAKALEYIHGKGIVHRDIKPSNIYISGQGDVKLGDFGIASSSSRNVNITDSGAAMGTPAYMAPEQFDDSSTVGKEADLFSFGVTLYEALTAQKPFNAEKYTALKQDIRRGKYTSPVRFRKKIPLFFRFMIRRCLFKSPRLRPKNAGQLRRRLEREGGNRSFDSAREELTGLIPGKGKSRKTNSLTKVVTDQTSRKKGKIFLPFVAVALLASLVLFFAAGGLHRVILRQSYGGLLLRIIPFDEGSRYTVFPHSSDREISGTLNRDGEKYLHLREGSYRMRIQSGSTLFWRSFYISSYSENRNPMEITLLSSPPVQLPLYLNYTIRDRFSSDDLSGGTDVFISREGKWEILTAKLRSELKTDSSFDLQFRKEGYSDEICEVSARSHQTDIDLDILMTPLAAHLVIPPLEEGEMRINGSDRYFSLKTMRVEKIQLTDSESVVLELIPGTYSLSIFHSKGKYEKKIDLKGGSEYKVPEKN